MKKSKILRGFYMGAEGVGVPAEVWERLEQISPPLINRRTHTPTTHPKPFNPKVAIIYGMTHFRFPLPISHAKDPMNRFLLGNSVKIEFRGSSLDRASLQQSPIDRIHIQGAKRNDWRFHLAILIENPYSFASILETYLSQLSYSLVIKSVKWNPTSSVVFFAPWLAMVVYHRCCGNQISREGEIFVVIEPRAAAHGYCLSTQTGYGT